MTMNLTVGSDTIQAKFNWGSVLPWGEVDDGGGGGISYQPAQLTYGTAAGQANVHYYQSAYTLAAGGMLSLNLASLTDPVFATAMTFVRLKRLAVSLLTTTTASSVLVGVPNILDPTVAPTLTSATGTLTAGTWYAAYSWKNAAGETKISPVQSIVMDGSHQFSFGALTLPTGATGVNYYVSLVANAHALALAGTNADGSSFVVSAAPSTSAATTPQTNGTGNGVSSLFYMPNGGIQVRNGECFYLGISPDAIGHAVAGSSTLNIYNQDLSNQATLQFVVDGCNA